MDEICEPLACQPPIIANGMLIPQSSSMLHAAATIICDAGYLMDSGLRVSLGKLNFLRFKFGLNELAMSASKNGA